MIARTAFGRHTSGRAVDVITLENSAGTRIAFLTYGGVIHSLELTDRVGKRDDVTLGFDRLEEYYGSPFYFGAIVGRNANRIARGRLLVDGHAYALTINNAPNHLHGGTLGLHQALWQADTFERVGECGAILTAASAAGDDGYPGTVSVRVRYTLSDSNEFHIAYEATTDAPTPVNLTQHAYFNLSGVPGNDVREHVLGIDADAFTPVDDTLMPTGEFQTVQGTPFDFREPHAIGRDLERDDAQLALGHGYDHNWVLNRSRDSATSGKRHPSLRRAASLMHPPTGRSLEVLTTEAGLQVYAGGTFTPGLTGKGGVRYPRFGGIALETQAYPDAPNQPSFPSTILRPGERHESTTVWRFGVAP